MKFRAQVWTGEIMREALDLQAGFLARLCCKMDTVWYSTCRKQTHTLVVEFGDFEGQRSTGSKWFQHLSSDQNPSRVTLKGYTVYHGLVYLGSLWPMMGTRICKPVHKKGCQRVSITAHLFWYESHCKEVIRNGPHLPNFDQSSEANCQGDRNTWNMLKPVAVRICTSSLRPHVLESLKAQFALCPCARSQKLKLPRLQRLFLRLLRLRLIGFRQAVQYVGCAFFDAHFVQLRLYTYLFHPNAQLRQAVLKLSLPDFLDK